MITKTRKKIASILVAAALLCPMFVMSVSAANTTDVSWSMTSSNSGFKYLGASRVKTDGTPMYFKWKTSVSSYVVRVEILGTNAQPVTNWGQVYNWTYKNGKKRNYAVCNKGINYSLHSYVYEKGYPYVTSGITTDKNEKISGVWSADSKNTYNEAVYY